MESLEEKIKTFLTASFGDGDGDGSGSGSGSGDDYGIGYGIGYGHGLGYGIGYGDGSGSGDGSGNGLGDGYGYGDGSGNGYGYGDGIKERDDQKVYYVDGIPTLIDSVHGNYAKGYIIKNDLNLTPCYIAKAEGCFAHGETLHKAFSDATNKTFENLPIDERIEKFVAEYPDKNMVVANLTLFDWHNRLTGSCEMGRRTFASEHGIDVDSGSMSIAQFIDLTQNSYGSEVIKQLKERYK